MQKHNQSKELYSVVFRYFSCFSNVYFLSVIIRLSSRTLGDDSLRFKSALLKSRNKIKLMIHFHDLLRRRNSADIYIDCLHEGQVRSNLPFKEMLYGKQSIVSSNSSYIWRDISVKNKYNLWLAVIIYDQSYFELMFKCMLWSLTTLNTINMHININSKYDWS